MGAGGKKGERDGERCAKNEEGGQEKRQKKKGTAATPVAFDFREESEGHRHRPANRPGVPTRKTTPVVCTTAADGPSRAIAHVLRRHGYRRGGYAPTVAAVTVVTVARGTLGVATTFASSSSSLSRILNRPAARRTESSSRPAPVPRRDDERRGCLRICRPLMQCGATRRRRRRWRRRERRIG